VPELAHRVRPLSVPRLRPDRRLLPGWAASRASAGASADGRQRLRFDNGEHVDHAARQVVDQVHDAEDPVRERNQIADRDRLRQVAEAEIR
jgi:hypothetical protein